MSATRGSLTYARFFVRGDAPEVPPARALRAVHLHAFRPLVPDEEQKESVGWCRFGEAFDLQPGQDDVFVDEFVNLGLRVDRWAVPGALLRARLRDAEAELLAQKGRERLTRAEKKELKEQVSRRLRHELPPRTRAFDVSWAPGSGVVRLFTQAAGPALALGELFKRTFKLELVAESPYTLSARLGMSAAREAAWADAEPTTLLEEAR
ncbi:MAG: hypothetical protein IT374_20755 [Polyangiaceae bacterium]|nr:hypothetical protein [Polyangiaceae bacterium]